MRYLTILLFLFSCTSPELKAQKEVAYEYEKKMNGLTFKSVKETYRGPVCVTLSNENNHKIDTIIYVPSVSMDENVIYDTYFTDDYIFAVTASITLTAEIITKERGIWKGNPWTLQILSVEERLLPFKISIIDQNTLKVTKNEKNYIYKLDFTNQRVDITEQN